MLKYVYSPHGSDQSPQSPVREEVGNGGNQEDEVQDVPEAGAQVGESSNDKAPRQNQYEKLQGVDGQKSDLKVECGPIKQL